VIVAARNEADRIAATLAALRESLPGASLWVADDASADGTAEAAMAAGAQVVSRGRPHGKGANMTAAVEAALSAPPVPPVVLLCDGDLGASAARLAPLVEAVRRDECDIAVARFQRRVGGGLGLTLGVARAGIRWLGAGLEVEAPISGQRALRVEALRAALPFAAGYGMEVGMTIDAARAGYRLLELELDLEHRATGRSPAGFLHRGRQLVDIGRALLRRRRERA
jgi:glycosyltransferase involved in cell wall biosynthesis